MNLKREVRLLSRRESDRSSLLADTDLFFFFLRGGKFESEAESVIDQAVSGIISLMVSSEVYDDAISAIRADGASLDVARSFVSDMKSIPHTCLPLSAEVAEEAMNLYIKRGGRLSYFDAFHVATAKRFDLPLLTSDSYLNKNAKSLQTKVLNLAPWQKKGPRI
jgi:predicted nucleic acid-binding protein